MKKWTSYIKGNPARQEVFEQALRCIALKKDVSIDEYMSTHRRDTNVDEVLTHFNAVIDWVATRFPGGPYSQQKGLDWGSLYLKYGDKPYSAKDTKKRVEELMADEAVKNKKGIFEYILAGERPEDRKLLKVRIFETATARAVYAEQTKQAESNGVSNCPICASSGGSSQSRVYKFSEMEADHVQAWSNGGDTSRENCQLLCRTHNRAKGNF